MCEVNWQMVLEYLKVGLSWPPVSFIGGLLFVWTFRPQIAEFLAGVERVKAGPLEATRRAAEQQEQAQASKVKPPFPLPGAGAGEMVAPTAQAAHQAEGTAGPAPAASAPPAAIAQETPEAVDWTIPEAAIRLAPPIPGADLHTVAQWVRRNPGPTVKDFVVLNANLQAERTFNLIFGTQVDLLEYLRLAPGEHPTTDLLPFHEKHVLLANAPQPIAVPAYLGFLLNQGVIENTGPAGGPTFRLTRFGEHFLGYIKQFYPFIWNKRGF